MFANQQFDCIKIKDGLYLGNLAVCEDYEFLMVNKLFHVVNCTSEVPNLFEEHGIKYLQFKLVQKKSHKLVGSQLKKIKKMQKFIQACNKTHTCCLVHSYHGQNRSSTMIIGYLMYQYQWTLDKAQQFVKSKAPNIAISQHYRQQLTKLQIMLSGSYAEMGRLGWNGPYISEQEEIICKTFINSQHITYTLKNYCLMKKSKRVKWFQKNQNKCLKSTKQKQEKLMDYFQKPMIIREEQQQSKHSDKIESVKETKSSRSGKKKPQNQQQDKFTARSCIFNSGRVKKYTSKNSLNSKLKNQEDSNIRSTISPPNQDNVSNPSENNQIDTSNNSSKIYKFTINNFINPKIKLVNKGQRQENGGSKKHYGGPARRSGSSTGRSEKNSRVTSEKQPENPYNISYKFPPKPEKTLLNDKKSPKTCSMKQIQNKYNPDKLK